MPLPELGALNIVLMVLTTICKINLFALLLLYELLIFLQFLVKY